MHPVVLNIEQRKLNKAELNMCLKVAFEAQEGERKREVRGKQKEKNFKTRFFGGFILVHKSLHSTWLAYLTVRISSDWNISYNM